MFNIHKDISDGLKKFPFLHLNTSGKFLMISGQFIAFDSLTKVEIETYDVMISFPAEYPFCFPFVEETGGKIPRTADRHVNGNGRLCFAGPQEEYSLCRNGITLSWFLSQVLNTHLCREYVREKTGKYPTGERSHGIEGVWEGYFDLLATNEKEVVLKELEMMLDHHKIGRNAPCYCGKAKKFKACHEKIEHEIFKAGKSTTRSLYEILKKDYQNKLKKFSTV